MSLGDIGISIDTWVKLCKSTRMLQDRETVEDIVCSIFDGAENVLIGIGFVSFEIEGIRINLSTDRRSILIYTNWYKPDLGKPKLLYSAQTKKMQDYFSAIDSNKPWYECVQILYRCNKLLTPFYFIKTKLNPPDRMFWEKRFRTIEQNHKKSCEEYEVTRKAISNKADRFINCVMPQILTFCEGSRERIEFFGCYDDTYISAKERK